MSSQALVLRVIDVLIELKTPFMIVGSSSSNLYGIPRSTQDMDFLVDWSDSDVITISSRLAPEIQLAHDICTNPYSAARRFVATAPESAFRFEFFPLSDDLHDQIRFKRRRTVSIRDRAVSVPTAEDVIITKLRWSKGGKRSKDLDDVRNVLAVQTDLDWDELRHWCDHHGTRDLLETIRTSLPTNL